MGPKKSQKSQTKISRLFKAKASSSVDTQKKSLVQKQVLKQVSESIQAGKKQDEPIDLEIEDSEETQIQENVVEETQIQDIKYLGLDKQEIIEKLKSFDLDYKYGPCLGLSRLERYQRAVKLNLDPPSELLSILETLQGKSDEELRECLWYNRV